ncbi:MAG TPA: DNA gyrase subunit A, partial [Sulfurihydrogenibium sp.]|nr:DNA gyrase subunit A [Sulfurihydrogenibium sp.]
IELKRDADAEKVLKKLYKSTPLEKNFPVNLTVLVDKQPRVLNLKELLQEFIKHRIEIITRRTLFELEKAENRLHIVEGLITALENADKVIEIVRSSKDTAQARQLLTSQFNLSETQANAILDMRLSRFTSLETQKLKDESIELKQKIERYKQILSSDNEKIKVFIEETDELVRKYGDQRKTTIATEKELTFKEHFMFAILNTGRIVNYKVEDETSKADILQRIINSLSISLTEGEKIVSIQEVEGSKPIAFFTKDGKAYWSLVIDLPKGEDKLNIEGEIVGTAYQGEGEENRVFLITKKGIIKRMSDEDIFYKSQGHTVMPLNEGDELVVAVADRHPSYIGIYTKNADLLLFERNEVRITGDKAKGVEAIDLDENDEVAGAFFLNGHEYLLISTSFGYMKLVEKTEFPIKKRAQKGLLAVKLNKDDYVVSILPVNKSDEVLINTKHGKLLKLKIDKETIPVEKRTSLGKNLFKFEADRIVNVLKLPLFEESKE